MLARRFHSAMLIAFSIAFGWTLLYFFDMFLPWTVSLPADIWGKNSAANNLYSLSLFIPFLYFVVRGAWLLLGDIERGFRKVNNHLDSDARWSAVQNHGGRHYIYDSTRNEWYVFAAHIEQWKPSAPPV